MLTNPSYRVPLGWPLVAREGGTQEPAWPLSQPHAPGLRMPLGLLISLALALPFWEAPKQEVRQPELDLSDWICFWTFWEFNTPNTLKEHCMSSVSYWGFLVSNKNISHSYVQLKKSFEKGFPQIKSEINLIRAASVEALKLLYGNSMRRGTVCPWWSQR